MRRSAVLPSTVNKNYLPLLRTLGRPTKWAASFSRARQSGHVFCHGFKLLELDGEDLRREPFETRKATLASLLRGCLPGLRINEHLPYPGDVVFRHACKMGLEGIVSKRLGSRCRSGRSKDWLKFKNPAAPAVKREAEQDWGKNDGNNAGSPNHGGPVACNDDAS
jgi:ATP-dependent DNA ligase